MFVAFCMMEDGSKLLIAQNGEVIDLTIEEVIAEMFGSAATPQVAELTDADYFVDKDEVVDEDTAVPDLELLGDDGDPGDRILPEEFVRSGNPVEDEGLVEDVHEISIRGDVHSVDGHVYAMYSIYTPRSADNPYGSKHSFAGLPEVKCPLANGNCLRCTLVARERGTQTPCAATLERHPYVWEGSTLLSLPYFFQVIAVLPRRLRNEWKGFIGRDGRYHRVQKKDAPVVIVRCGDIDEAGNFIPGVVDERTGERRELFLLAPAWSLYNIKTGERFQYEEPKTPVRPLNASFKARVFGEAKRLCPELYTKVLHPKHDLGVAFWEVKLPEGGCGEATLRVIYSNGARDAVRIPVEDGRVTFRPKNALELFALQALVYKVLEAKMLAEGRDA